LEGLPQEFGPVISVVESKFDIIDIDEVEFLLIAHETRLDKFKKKTLDDAASLNLTHASASNTQSQPQPDASMLQASVHTTSGPDFSNFPSHFGSSRGRGERAGRGRGRGSRFANVQCQVCFKFAHLANSCWNRFNQQFHAPIPPNCQGSMPAASDPYHVYNSGMSSYGPNHSGYGVSPPSYGANMAYNPFQQW